MTRSHVGNATFLMAVCSLALGVWAQPLDLPLRGASGEIILGLGTLESAAYSPDGRYIATCGGLGAFLWDVETGELIRWFSGHTGVVNSVAFSPDGSRVLTGSGDATAKLWDAQTGQQIRTFAGHTNWVWSVAFSPDGMRVLTASFDGTARIWDISDLPVEDWSLR